MRAVGWAPLAGDAGPGPAGGEGERRAERGGRARRQGRTGGEGKRKSEVPGRAASACAPLLSARRPGGGAGGRGVEDGAEVAPPPPTPVPGDGLLPGRLEPPFLIDNFFLSSSLGLRLH